MLNARPTPNFGPALVLPRCGTDIDLPAVAVAHLSIDALAAYCWIAYAQNRGEPTSVDTVAAGRFDGDAVRAEAAIDELLDRNVLRQPDVHAAERAREARDWAELIYGSRWLPEDDGPDDTADLPPRPAKRDVPKPKAPALVTEHAKIHSPEADGQWRGPWPLTPTTHYPPRGQSVVYVLRAGNDLVVYVGSTDHFTARMKAHTAAGKSWTSWSAQPCESRDEAYEVESEFLREYMPHLNVAGPRRSGAAT